MRDSQIGQDLAIELDFGFFEAVNKLGITDFLRGQSGIDPRNPQLAQVSFATLAADKSILTGVQVGLFGNFVEPPPSHPKTLGALQHFLMAMSSGKTGFNSHLLMVFSLRGDLRPPRRRNVILF